MDSDNIFLKDLGLVVLLAVLAVVALAPVPVVVAIVDMALPNVLLLLLLVAAHEETAIGGTENGNLVEFAWFF
jgi:hypothetical protein